MKGKRSLSPKLLTYQFGMRMLLSTGLVVYSLLATVTAKIHLLALTDESRRNILLSKFGYNPNGTFDFVFSNFTVPEAVISPVGSSTHLIDDATMDRGFVSDGVLKGGPLGN